MEPGNQNKTKLMKTNVESNREDGWPRRKHKRQKCENSKSLTDTTNNNIYNRGISPSGNIDHGTDKMTNTKTNTITTSDKGSNEKAVEAAVKRLYDDWEKEAIAIIAKIARQIQTKQSME